MRILIDIGHPAHVHMFKCIAREMISKGHKVLFTCRDKEFEIRLLRDLGFDYVNFGKKSKGTFGKIWDLIRFNYKEWRVARKYKPDVFLSHGSITASHVAWLLGKPSIAYEDTFNMEQIKLWEPFVSVILTSDYDHPLKSNKVIKYPGYNELLYLHPNRFSSNVSIKKDLGVEDDEKYTIVRFVSWEASHDRGHSGISLENKFKAIEMFSKYGKVFISSEGKLPSELEKYRFPLSASRMHDAMAYASLIFGESATMVSEGVMLGVPSVYIDNTGRYYTNDIESKYGLCFNYTESAEDQISAINKGVEILSSNKSYSSEHSLLLKEKIDCTAFLTWFIENYPASREEAMKADKEFWKGLCKGNI